MKGVMKFKKTSLASAMALVFCGPLYAQNTLQTTIIETESIERDAVVEVLTSEDIDVRQIGDFEDMVRLVPGISVSKGDDRWGSSGFNIRGLDEDRVAINVDGVPQGETLKYEGGQAYGYFKGSRSGVDVEALKSIEIVKGADAILSGSGALAGAVNMTTKDPSDFLSDEGNDSGFRVKAGYSSVNEEAMGSLSLANRVGNFESMLIYTYRDGGEYKNFDMNGADIEGSGREIPDPQNIELNSVLVKLIYKFSPGTELGFVGSYYDKNRNTDTQSFNGGWYSNRMGNDTNNVSRVGLFYKMAAETAMFDNMTIAVNHQTTLVEAKTTQHVEFNFGPTFLADEDRVSTRSFDQELTQLTVDFDKAFSLGGSEHNFVYGIEFLDKGYENKQLRLSNSLLNDDGWIESNRGALIPASDADVLTAYAMDIISINDDATQFRIGARYDGYKYNAHEDENYTDGTGTLGEVSFSTATWTLGVEQVLTSIVSVELGVSTGFRAPTIEDMYRTSGSFDDWSVIPNADLKPEYSTNLDLAFTGDFETGNYSVGVFYSKYDDFIDFESLEGINTNTGEPDPNGFSRPVNSDGVDIYGYELSVNYAFGAGFSTGLQASYTKGESANNDPVYSIQPLNAIWNIGYNSAEDTWGVTAYTSYTKGKTNRDSFLTDNDGVVTYPLYLSNTATVIDVITYYNISDKLTLTAGVYNLTDKEYYNWDSVRFVDQGDQRPGIGVTGDGVKRYSEPGRNFKLSISYQL